MASTDMPDIVRRCVQAAGGVRALAAALNIRAESIYSWRKIPSGRVIGVERATGIPREELRPDLADVFRRNVA